VTPRNRPAPAPACAPARAAAAAFRDGYVQLPNPLPPQLASALASMPYGSVLPLQVGDLDGFLPRILLELQRTLGFTLEFSVITPPLNLVQAQITDPMLLYMFNVMNASCALWPVTTTPARRYYYRQTAPVLHFSYQVVTTRPVAVLPSKMERIFLWTKPFTPGLWALLMGSVLTSSLLYPLLEARNGNDFQDVHSTAELMGHAVYLAAMGPSKPDTFEPSTAAGRASAALHAFSVLLIISAYTANLAAQFTTTDPPVQAIQSVDDFSAAAPMCIRSSTTLLAMLNATVPAALAAVSPNNTMSLSTYGTGDAVRAVLAGQCVGALLPTTEASWVMQLNDTAGELCGVEAVGAAIATEGIPLTFAASALTDAQLEAMNSVISDLQRSAGFLLATQELFFPPSDTPRVACAAQDAAEAQAAATLAPAARLEPIDLAGAFVLQAIGLCLGLLLHFTKMPRFWLKSAIVDAAHKRGLLLGVIVRPPGWVNGAAAGVTGGNGGGTDAQGLSAAAVTTRGATLVTMGKGGAPEEEGPPAAPGV
jgi:hypothetical protein